MVRLFLSRIHPVDHLVLICIKELVDFLTALSDEVLGERDRIQYYSLTGSAI